MRKALTVLIAAAFAISVPSMASAKHYKPEPAPVAQDAGDNTGRLVRNGLVAFFVTPYEWILKPLKQGSPK